MNEWKNGEVGYCLRLVRDRGDRNVPRESVAAYLDVQFYDALRDRTAGKPGAVEAVEALDHIAAIWEERK